MVISQLDTLYWHLSSGTEFETGTSADLLSRLWFMAAHHYLSSGWADKHHKTHNITY
jgi:hypothetical protein